MTQWTNQYNPTGQRANVGDIDFTLLLEDASKEELQELMENEDKINEIVLDHEKIRKLKLEKELTQAANRSIADDNVSKEPQLNHLREEVAEKYEKLKDLHDMFLMNQGKLGIKDSVLIELSTLLIYHAILLQMSVWLVEHIGHRSNLEIKVFYENAESSMDDITPLMFFLIKPLVFKESLHKDVNLETMLAVLQTTCAETEEESEKLAEGLFSGDVTLTDFLANFKTKRTLAHMRRIKTEKMRELVLEVQRNPHISAPVIPPRIPAATTAHVAPPYPGGPAQRPYSDTYGTQPRYPANAFGTSQSGYQYNKWS